MSRRPPPPRIASARPAALPHEVDVVVAGAGVVGLAVAVEAVSRGASVVVVERDPRPAGASARSLGHVAVTAQDGPALAYALTTRDKWLALGRQAGFAVGESGSVVVARAEDELVVLDDFVAARDGAARLLDRTDLSGHLAVVPEGAVGGAFLATDLLVDPRTALTAVVAWLGRRRGASVVTGTSVLGVEPGNGRSLVRTSRGDVVARRVVLATGHGVDRLFPAVTDEHGLRRQVRHALRVDAGGAGPATAVLDGTALLHHAGFTRSPRHKLVRERLERERPELVAHDVFLRATRQADGSVLLGDAGTDAADGPFRDEVADEVLLREGERLLGGPLRVRERWAAVETSAPGPFLVCQPQRGLLVMAATASLGLSTAFGLAPRALDGFL